MPPAEKDLRKPLSSLSVRFLALGIFVVLAGAIAGVSYRYYRSQKEAIEHEVRNQLLSTADLKATEISEWAEGRMDEVRVIIADHAAAREMQRLASGNSLPSDLVEVRTWLEEVCRRFHYASATLVDGRGNTVVSVGKLFGDTDHIRMAADEVLHANKVVVHDLHLDGVSAGIHLGMNLPLRVSVGTPLFGVLLLGIDPELRLYPMLHRWPVPSQSGDTVLVRRESNEVVCLNGLRFRPDAALRLRIPLSRRENPAVQAVLGAQGIVEGTDYRGVPVIAAVRAIPGMPWFLVAKMDREEVEAPIRRRARLLLFATLSLILGAGAGVFTIWRRQQLRFYRARYEAEMERQALVGHYDYLSRFANDIILLIDETGRIVEANDRAAATYGYSREELLRMTIRDLRHPSSLGDFEGQWKDAAERGSLVFETVHQRRDGRPFPVEVSVRVIQAGETPIRQSIIRDITERKALDEKLRRMLDAYQRGDRVVCRGHRIDLV